MKNVITYEQASNLNKLDEVASTYYELHFSMVRFFMKNTAAQFSQFDFYSELLDLTEPYTEKDYSNYLFKKTADMYEQFQAMEPQFKKATETFTEAAKIMSKLALKENK